MRMLYRGRMPAPVDQPRAPHEARALIIMVAALALAWLHGVQCAAGLVSPAVAATGTAITAVSHTPEVVDVAQRGRPVRTSPWPLTSPTARTTAAGPRGPSGHACSCWSSRFSSSTARPGATPPTIPDQGHGPEHDRARLGRRCPSWASCERRSRFHGSLPPLPGQRMSLPHLGDARDTRMHT